MINNKEITKNVNYKHDNLILIIKRNNKIQHDTADGNTIKKKHNI